MRGEGMRAGTRRGHNGLYGKQYGAATRSRGRVRGKERVGVWTMELGLGPKQAGGVRGCSLRGSS